MTTVPLDSIHLYVWGVVGSAAVEIVAATKAAADHGGAVPKLYRSPFYLTMRIGLALVAAGSLPIAFDAANAYSALYLGASAPIVFDRLQRGFHTP